jgi:hypothetical protein
MMFGLQLPFQRRRTRWEQLRDTLAERAELARRMQDAQRLREAFPDTSRLRESLPDPADLARRAQPLVDRMAAIWPEMARPETPDFLQEGLDRLSGALGRKKPSASERVLNAELPLWLALGLALGAFVAGYALGQAATAQRRSSRQADLEGAADQIKERWPAIHDDDIREAKGNLKRLSSVVSERTGERARDVRERLVAMTTGQSANGGSSSNGGSAPA